MANIVDLIVRYQDLIFVSLVLILVLCLVDLFREFKLITNPTLYLRRHGLLGKQQYAVKTEQEQSDQDSEQVLRAMLRIARNERVESELREVYVRPYDKGA